MADDTDSLWTSNFQTGRQLGSNLKVAGLATTEDVANYEENAELGVALIFYHVKTPGFVDQPHIKNDADNLDKALKQIGFKSSLYKDLKFDEITKKLREVTMNSKIISKSECIVIAILTNNIDGEFYASDKPYNFSEIWTLLTGDKCPLLFGKPKIFIAQACHGIKLDPGVSLIGESPLSKKSLFKRTTKYIHKLPRFADFLFAHSILEVNTSFKNENYASWYINTICENLEKIASDENAKVDILHFFTDINKSADNFPIGTNIMETEELSKMPCFTSTLTKIFFLRKKIPKIQD